MEPRIDGPAVSIRTAVWPADEAVARTLLLNYADHLASGPHGSAAIQLDSQEFDTLAESWSAPGNILFLGFLGSGPVGCIGVRVLACGGIDSACELKRLWVDAQARGHGLGRRLIQHALEWAGSHGAETVLLDTVPAAMPLAVELYRSLGFRRTRRYNDNRVRGIMFMKLTL